MATRTRLIRDGPHELAAEWAGDGERDDWLLRHRPALPVEQARRAGEERRRQGGQGPGRSDGEQGPGDRRLADEVRTGADGAPGRRGAAADAHRYAGGSTVHEGPAAMMHRLWGWIVHPWRRDRAFARRMHDARCAALEQSRISVRQQRHLRERTNFM